MIYSACVALLPPEHKAALEWFRIFKGRRIPWPDPINSLFLVNRAKGIHKPEGWQYALSVRQTLGSPYADGNFESLAGQRWSYNYAQEGVDPTKRDDRFTNRALMRNIADAVPVGVLRQLATAPTPLYEVEGVAAVVGWENGYFRLESFDDDGSIPLSVSFIIEPEPINLEDAKRRVISSIVSREGAGQFRLKALRAFNDTCAVTECNAIDALEAAHIVPYLGAHTNLVSNAILLRSDIHTLFDKDLIKIDADSLQVTLDKKLKVTTYAYLDGKNVALPVRSRDLYRRAFEQRRMLLDS